MLACVLFHRKIVLSLIKDSGTMHFGKWSMIGDTHCQAKRDKHWPTPVTPPSDRQGGHSHLGNRPTKEVAWYPVSNGKHLCAASLNLSPLGGLCQSIANRGHLFHKQGQSMSVKGSSNQWWRSISGQEGRKVEGQWTQNNLNRGKPNICFGVVSFNVQHHH